MLDGKPPKGGFFDLRGTEMNWYRIFKITSIWFFMLCSFLGGKNAFAAWTYFEYQSEANSTCVASNENKSCDHTVQSGTIGATGQTYEGHYFNDDRAWGNRTFYYGSSGSPPPPEPDIQDCDATGDSGVINLAADADIPDYVWANGCRYTTGGVAACTSTDGWITMNCAFTYGDAVSTREPDQTCTPEQPCVGNAEEGESETVQPNPTEEQIDETAEGESHPDYDHPSDTAPDETEFDTSSGDINMTVETADNCTHEITIKPDGTVTENISGTDCQAIIFRDRDYGSDNINYTDPSQAPDWSFGSNPGTSGSTGDVDTTPNGTPNYSPDNVDIDTTDTPDTTCDPATQDCDGTIVGLLSDIKELLSFDDETVITDAANQYNADIEQAATDIEALGNDEIDIDGFNIDDVVKDVLNLPSTPPNHSDTFTLSGEFHLGQKEIVIEGMYEKLSMMRTFLKWVFFIFTCFSCYQILFSRPLI